ncbi:family 16 glycoside hydrolase [Flavivirga abyssicola]|uniref:family 16 glycoside hydrolase n=1 Tax=Flavivirga abyssicola TaxID=3063533 RepID=UPI0026DEF403|nr:family 16 glycoside hydrolase [Flavivirga sp. MEBiC07777]WVK13760.1 family 16 glycoside hydrolase [Flavivirga sp. MEBiC07777]
MKFNKFYAYCLRLFTGVLLLFSCHTEKKLSTNSKSNWALDLPNGHPAWFSVKGDSTEVKGEIWTVGQHNKIFDIKIVGDTLYFKRKSSVGKPKYVGGSPTGSKVVIQNRAVIYGDEMQLIANYQLEDGTKEKETFTGKRLPPLPFKPNLDSIQYDKPPSLFNGKNLEGWELTNPNQKNGWIVENGIMVNKTPKRSFEPFSKYGNLRTKQEFEDFNLKLEVNVPKGGNSGIYLKGRYEVQVVDRDSRMQGIQGIGSVFGRVRASENAGKEGGKWQQYDITLVNQHITVILNGKKVIDNQPIEGATKGALSADDTKSGPIYFQGDHTAVKYKNIILTPVIKSSIKKAKTKFVDFDLNSDEKLQGKELAEFNLDYVDHVDKNIDGALNKKEFRVYHKFVDRMNAEQALIPKHIKIYKNIPYVENGHRTQTLDLYFPKNYTSDKPMPLVIWVHGGGWNKLSKEDFGKHSILLEHGFAMASINYRLSRHDIFPAQIHDTKAAIRYLRKYASDYHIDPNNFGLWGSSAGGHLVALAGLTGSTNELEGSVGVTDVSSHVNAVCDWFGPSDMIKIVEDLNVQNGTTHVPNITNLLGGTNEEKPLLAKQSSPIQYVSKDDPPFLLMHGDQDKLVPLNQSVILHEKLKDYGIESDLVIIEGAKHAFFKEQKELNYVIEFFKKHLSN